MKKFIGNKDFYKLVAALALPLLLQNAVSTFVNLLDNLMVGRIGTESMSGVSIVNQRHGRRGHFRRAVFRPRRL